MNRLNASVRNNVSLLCALCAQIFRNNVPSSSALGAVLCALCAVCCLNASAVFAMPDTGWHGGRPISKDALRMHKEKSSRGVGALTGRGRFSFTAGAVSFETDSPTCKQVQARLAIALSKSGELFASGPICSGIFRESGDDQVVVIQQFDQLKRTLINTLGYRVTFAGVKQR